MHILIADSDRSIANLLTIYIKQAKYIPIVTYNKENILNILQSTHDINLIIIDFSIHDHSDLKMLRAIRSNFYNLPVIVLSSKATDMDKIKGLVNGADDYIAKPFNPILVMIRIKSILRRIYNYNNKSSNVINTGTLLINSASHQVQTFNGKTIQLSYLDFHLLYLLASHPNQTFSNLNILKNMNSDKLSNKTIMIHINHIHNLLSQATGDNNIIQTIWGVGYKLSA